MGSEWGEEREGELDEDLEEDHDQFGLVLSAEFEECLWKLEQIDSEEV